MRRGNRQVQLDSYLLRVLELNAGHLKGGWISLDELDDWAVEFSEDQDKGFDDWFMDMNHRARAIAVFKSLERLVEMGRAEKRRDKRCNIMDTLQYRKLNVLDALAKVAKEKTGG